MADLNRRRRLGIIWERESAIELLELESHRVRVGTGRTPSAVPSSSNFPASHLGSELGLIA
jgi:hypothetical protein